MSKLPITIDFDGTVVSHKYPHIGEENPKCVEVLKKWVENGVGLILDTMRSGKELKEAEDWFKDRDIELYGVNKNPTQETWTDSPKAYGIYSIDDRNIGCPLIEDGNGRLMVDWATIDKYYSENIINLAKLYDIGII